MEAGDLRKVLEATLAMERPTAIDLRDALVDYFAVVGGRFIRRGLAYTQPEADAEAIRRLYELRLRTLWRGMRSPFDRPSLADLANFRKRIEQYACVDLANEELRRVRRMLDDLALAVTVRERLDAVKKRRQPVRKLWSIPGGCETSPPRGRLRLVGAASVPESTRGAQ